MCTKHHSDSLNFKITIPQKKDREMYIPSDNDIKALLKSIEGTELEKAVLLAAFGTLRSGEVDALTSDDINGNVITVNKTVTRSKGGEFVTKQPKTPSSIRKIEYPEFVIKKFNGIDGKLVDIKPGRCNDQLQIALKQAGLPQFRFHDLRHYVASIMHAIGVPEAYILERGGWRTAHTLNKVYRHVMDEKKKEVISSVNSHFESILYDSCDTTPEKASESA